MIKKNKNVRLPHYVYPIRYNIEIRPDLESSTFSGKEIIQIEIKKETNKIILHSKNIDIETAKIISNKKEEFCKKITYNLEKETATILFPQKINIGKIKLSIIFSGIINEELHGLYKSKYVLNGEEKYLATTQFEATDARQAFPCFDEPDKKAVFEVSLIVPKNYSAISNTLPIEIKEHDSGYKIVSFSPTPIMSTYLLAIITGELEFIEGYVGKTKIRIFTTLGKKHQANFALDIAKKSIGFYNEYFGIPYPLSTLDLIAIPDFASGAMENWGAITFRETAILIDDEKSSLSNKQWVAIVIAHEISHQWFGNLVTMNWWTDLWLNEGFASYMEKVCIDFLFPEWNIWETQIASGRFRNAMEIDSLLNSHPIEIEVYHPNEISEIFDMVSYEKGSAIIRMLANYLGEDNFKEGLKYYLNKHSYGNAKTINLWEAFEYVSNKPITKMMQTWTKQMGFPIISLQKDKQGRIRLSQERYFSSRISRKNNKNNYLWQIPISIGKQQILLNKKNNILKIDIKDKINHGETSFIRVNYGDEIINKIKEEIKNNHVNTIDKLGIIRDTIMLMEGGYIKTSKALELFLIFREDKEYAVWSEISYGINKIFNIIRDDKEIKDNLKRYAINLFSKITEFVTFEKKPNEKASDTLLRNLVIYESAFYGNKKIIKEAKSIFDNRIIKPIDKDLAGIIYKIVCMNGKDEEWKILKDMYRDEELHEEKERIARALVSFNEIKFIKKYLSFIMSREVKTQDKPLLICVALANYKSQGLIWKFIKDNWDLIIKKYGEEGHFISRIIESLGNHIKINDKKDVEKFFRKNPHPGAERTLLQSLEKIESNATWWKDDKDDIKKFFQE